MKSRFSCLLVLSIFVVKAQIPGIDDSRPARKVKPDSGEPSRAKIYSTLDIDKFPEFPGGVKAYYNFLSRNLKWPKGDEEAMGRVILSFVIERNGQLSNFKIERSVGTNIDAEALRVLKLSPKWTPAVKNEYKVRVKYFVSINFEYTN